MNTEKLWAPWRIAYITGEIDKPRTDAAGLPLLPGADPDCFICRAAADKDDRRNLVIHRGPRMFTILNRYPYNNGHVLVAPAVHKGRFDELTSEEQTETMTTITRMVDVLRESLNSEGFNVGINLGRVAGAGVPGHLHWHVVPRWSGDTNFMPVLSGVDVISQSLDALWELLSEKLRSV
ncbi:MAG: HIT domain-containing protein [Planctomycetia bacterium]|nr:HIT domain-containing protein [Planctomycetia bacterium]